LTGVGSSRRTEENVSAAGLDVVDLRPDGIRREIVAES
jgi:hypothetical protein